MVAEYSVWQQGVEVNYAALCEEKKRWFTYIEAHGSDICSVYTADDRWI